jgi:hypothetical protein
MQREMYTDRKFMAGLEAAGAAPVKLEAEILVET